MYSRFSLLPIVILICVSLVWSEEDVPRPDSTVIMGVLIDEDGLPYVDQNIRVFGENGKVVFQDGILMNPSTQSDDSGCFKLVVRDSIFDSKEPLTIWHELRYPLKQILMPLVDSTETSIVVVIDKLGGVIDLGPVRVKKKE